MTSRMDRRTALALLGTGVLGSRLKGAQAHLHAIRKSAEPPHLIFFDDAEHRLIDSLAEAIIPADEHSPGAHEARVGYYIDLVVGSSAVLVQETWKTEMAGFKVAAEQDLGKNYLDAGPAAQARFLSKMASSGAEPKAPAERFFARMKQMAIFGYYTSEIGLLKELEYKGNQALAEFPGCSNTEEK